jgi:hypothetical protein
MNSNPMHSSYSGMESSRSTEQSSSSHSNPAPAVTTYPGSPSPTNRLANSDATFGNNNHNHTVVSPSAANTDNSSKLAGELQKFQVVAQGIRAGFKPAVEFQDRCQQAFDVANDLFGNAPTWVCFYRELMGGDGFIPQLFPENEDFGNFLRCEQYYQVQMMLTALRSRDLPENDPNDPQRMITVRLPKSLHEALCDEAVRLGISVNRLCISRMLQLLDPKMIPETGTKPRGRKPRARSSSVKSTPVAQAPQPTAITTYS